jgi:hypothetical protein
MRVRLRFGILVVVGFLCASQCITHGANYREQWNRAWQDFHQNYSYFGLKQIDWDKVAVSHQSDFDNLNDPAAFAERLNDVLQVLHDWHVFVRKPDGTAIGFRGSVTPNYHPTKIVYSRYATGQPLENLQGAGAVIHGWIDTDIGYIAVLTLGSRFSDKISESDIDNLIIRYQNAVGIILDLRANAGGDESLAKLFANRCTEQSRVYSYVQNRIPGDDRNAFSDFLPKTIIPHAGTRYRGKVIALVGQRTISSAESFALMIRSIPGAMLIGDKTRGASGNPVIKALPELNVSYGISTWIAYDASKQPFEDRGIQPDVWIAPELSYDEERDYVLEQAVVTLKPASTNPQRVPDSWVRLNDLTLTGVSDTDNDGLTDQHEFFAGTNPRNANSRLRIVSIDSRSGQPGLSILWESVAAKRYSIWRTMSLATSFQLIQRDIPGANLKTEFTDATALGPGPWFYKIEVITN